MKQSHHINMDIQSSHEKAYDSFTELAALICGATVSFISFSGKSCYYIKSSYGFNINDTAEFLPIQTNWDPKNSPFVIYSKDLSCHSQHFEFFLSIPLYLENNIQGGSLCLANYSQKNLSRNQLSALSLVGKQIMVEKNKSASILEDQEDNLMTMLSHEIRTPLTSIYTSLSLLKSKIISQSSQKGEELLEVSLRNTEVLNILANKLFNIQTLDNKPLVLQKIHVEINRLISTCLEELKPLLDKCQVNAKTDFDDSLPNLYIDQEKASEAIKEMISNAVKYSMPRSSISVHTRGTDTELEIKVKDKGQGIPENKKPHVFKKFTKYGETDQNLPGAGLGLYFAEKYIQAHKGQITFESEVGVGTTFKILIPIYQK